jgi:7-keto-8-aminopelargonate synthetase-like enzyme
MIEERSDLTKKLQANTNQFRTLMKAAGFQIMGHEDSPIAPVFLKDGPITIKV